MRARFRIHHLLLCLTAVSISFGLWTNFGMAAVALLVAVLGIGLIANGIYLRSWRRVAIGTAIFVTGGVVSILWKTTVDYTLNATELTFAVRVVQATTFLPVANAKVEIYNATYPKQYWSNLTDGEGRTLIRVVVGTIASKNFFGAELEPVAVTYQHGIKVNAPGCLTLDQPLNMYVQREIRLPVQREIPMEIAIDCPSRTSVRNP